MLPLKMTTINTSATNSTGTLKIQTLYNGKPAILHTID